MSKLSSHSSFDRSQIVCTKTLYNYIDIGLLDIKNINLTIKLRGNTKPTRVNKHKKNLDTIISESPMDINTNTEFGHWEIDTVIAEKSTNNNVLLTIFEHKTRYSIVLDIVAKIPNAVTDALNKVLTLFGKQFIKVFKTITSDNGLEFTDLSTIELETDTKVYFTHLYSSFEKVIT